MSSQQPEQLLNKWSEQSPIEKIYFHFDRSNYIAGQTIWVKGYLYSDFLPGNRSTTLYVELLNASLSVINRQVFPIFGGFTRGQVELHDTLPEGAYQLRAYTATMLNHDPEFLYKKNFFIFKKNKGVASLIPERQKAMTIEFFPEGGNFITGLSNSIAYKATDPDGLPVNVSGVVKKETGEKVAEFSSYHDGMGYFDLTAEERSNYYAVLNGDPSGQKYFLPPPTTSGVVFRIISNGPTKSFEILQRSDHPLFKAAYMIGQMQHHVVFKKSFKENDEELTGIIPVSSLSSGILHVTVFNKDGLPLAERLTFVDNKEYIQGGDVIADTIDFSDRGKNRFTLSLKDTVSGSFSVSVTDAAFETGATRSANIFSGLLLTSDLRGYVHDPAYYFSATNDTVQTALDLVMMTNGWRRFKWEKIIKDGIPANKYSDGGYITLAGKINLKDTKNPFAGKDVMAFVVSPGSDKNIVMLKTDDKGYFETDSIVFFGRSRILFTDIKGRKSRFIDVKMEEDSLNKQYVLPEAEIPGFSSPGYMTNDQKKKMAEEYEAILKAEGIMLEGITVKGRKKTALEELEEKYVSSLFSGSANSTLDLTAQDLSPYQNILDYLQLRVVGLQISKESDGLGYTVTYRQSALASSMGVMPMTIFLDEVPSDADALASIPANQIALVKVFSSFVGASGNAPGGVLAVYTKKGADLSSLTSSGDIINYNGYSVLKEFYSPDYHVKKTNDKADNRITLYWNPAISAGSVNPKIPIVFYNNDRTRQFKIVVEGMTFDGKMLMIEKIIGPKKAF
ncbi:MAG TPA: hypothetical protein VI461_04070 [Chitinophagaceae bacterium]|nr:hypothetical protein [Chitinophagaceae bacterium]